jgi:phosphoribosylformylglycinamidine synthase
MHRDARPAPLPYPSLDLDGVTVEQALQRVLRFPAVATKNFLITIGDRSVGGLVCRDQMVGPWQVPVADAAVTCAGFSGFHGEAMAMGERTPLALLDAPASGRMAVAEAITNIACAPIAAIGDIKMSANWMAAAGADGEDQRLFETVRAVGMELCPALGIAIPVGKDSLSMQSMWHDDDGEERRMLAPLSLIVSAFAPVSDVRRCLTPQLRVDAGDTVLMLLDPSGGQQRLGGSALAQVYGQMGDTPPDVDHPERLRALFEQVQALNAEGLLLACHDRSDGGLISAALEMAFAARAGLEIDVPGGVDPLPWLFNEELGMVVQVQASRAEEVGRRVADAGLDVVRLASVSCAATVTVRQGGDPLLQQPLLTLQQIWAETSHGIQRRRDHPECADQEFDAILDASDPGLTPHVPYDAQEAIEAPMLNTGARPEIAILREQGVNGQVEMAAAFHAAGFRAVDVHMSDLSAGRFSLDRFNGLVACGGFSYGDVLGAGQGWAKAALFNDPVRRQFESFFADTGRFALGVCNGCQALAAMAEIIPGSDGWPRFVRNRSEQFEARLSLVEVLGSPSVLLAGMVGARIPVVVSHGEGRARFDTGFGPKSLGQRAALRYVNALGEPATRYPSNPNGSPGGLTGLCNDDGRVTLMMPHPERVFRSVQMSWAPSDWGEDSPWMRMFRNARVWIS